MACIPACEWVVNSKSVVLAADGRKWLACRFKEASKKGTGTLLIFDQDKIVYVIYKSSVLQAKERIKSPQKESNNILIL